MKRFMALGLAGIVFLTACRTLANSSDLSSDTPVATVPAEYAGKTNPYSSEMALQGETVFQTNCVICHGSQGHGDGPASQSLEPKPRNLAELQKNVGDDFLFWRITEGKPGTAMVAWKGILTEDQIWQVISFIHTLKE